MKPFRGREEGLILLAYLIVGLAAYARILGTFFVADDFVYLDAIQASGSPAVIFSPLAGRYFRPAVVLVYYLNYQIAGLSALSYHLSVVLMHVANAWLVFLLGRSLAPTRGAFVPALAGLLFLVFGGHAEAVAWIGGMADPLLTLFLLVGLLLFHRALNAPRPLPWLTGSWLAFAAALLTKESAAVFLGLAVAWAALGQQGWPDWSRVRRTAFALSVPVLLLGGYFFLRKVVLGSGVVNLEGLGTNTNLLITTRAFVLRSFLPQGGLLIQIWNRSLDVYILVPLAAALLWFARREEYRPLALLALCLGLAIAPVLPLSIEIAAPTSERFIYLPSAFACLLVVWLLDSALQRRWLVVATTVLFFVYHVRALDRNNRAWVAAATLTRGITSSFAQVMREHGRAGRSVYVLNAPDNVRGAYVWRRGFHDALRLAAPDQLAAMSRTRVLTVHTVGDEKAPVIVTQTGPQTFDLRLGSGALTGGPSGTPLWTLGNWSAQSFRAEFTPAAGRGLVVYFTPDQTRVAGSLSMSPIPFGYINVPADTIRCGGPDPDVLGWALDEEGVTRVTIAIEKPGASGGTVELGDAQKMARPDVTATYPGYPDSQNAGWSFKVPCAAVSAHAAGGVVHVRAIGENRHGAKATLGTRTVVFER